jgi:PIN domain nuclease of toxin-antitoxin system
MAGRLLLDSHILVWLDAGSPRLTPNILKTLRYADERYLSAATSWELGLKLAAGRLKLRVPVASMLPVFRLVELPVAMAHGDRAATLPMIHGDPFDRMLVAQALEENLILVTGDERLADYGVPVLMV